MDKRRTRRARMRRIGALLAALAAWAGAAAPAAAQVRPVARPAGLEIPPEGERVVPAAAAPAAPAEPVLGSETNLPLPRFVSLKTDEGNARRGPSLDHRIDWVFVREDMPLLITAEYGQWRRVEDREGLGGWMHYSLLSGSRTAIVDQNLLALRARPEEGAPEVALLEAGVVARVESCDPAWCRLAAGGHSGWAPKSALWGVGADEVID